MSLSPLTFSAALMLVAMIVGPAATLAFEGDARAKRFVERYETNVRPLEIAAARAFWNANVTGKEEDFQKKQEAEEKLELCLSDPGQFAELKAIKQGGVSDPLLAREITVLYLEYLAKQVEPALLKKMLAKSNAVERAFNVFRPKVDGKELTDNDIRRMLRESRDSAERAPPGRPARRSGRWSSAICWNWSPCGTKRPANWASRTITSCNSIAANRARSRCSRCSTNSTS